MMNTQDLLYGTTIFCIDSFSIGVVLSHLYHHQSMVAFLFITRLLKNGALLCFPMIFGMVVVMLVCVCVCLCVHTWMWVSMHLCVCGGWRVTSGSILCSLSTLFTEAEPFSHIITNLFKTILILALGVHMQVPMETRKECQSLQSWNYRWLYTTQYECITHVL